MPQNAKNHSRYLLIWHLFIPLGLGWALAESIIHYTKAQGEGKFFAWLFMLFSVILILIWFYARYFALRAQDRAIRAEENFRHYILTGKPFNKDLHMRQIIA